MSTNGTATATAPANQAQAPATATNPGVTTDGIGAAGVPEQLSLLATSGIPLQFRLDERTRRSGLAHIAALRDQIAAQAAARNLSTAGKRNAGGQNSARPNPGHSNPSRPNLGRQIAA